ncbi:MAG TPA: D-glycero-beta-D-manno-heptose 1-phosphate adenylyltransferase [Candidatus Cloacimonadota bacterium]|nr:D-glycero-beta-D-manno-heptose 1-phosphate adenylyltransferase [Candidatus Cloacimonadota bacterium]HOH79562.1 D-glycero-beta-D-manno-heptose 1-phosphate adenylyltransferase [Candidatus Cloacimonadota bacterium]
MNRDKIFSLNELKDVLGLYRNTGGRIVFTNGCFDIMHAGHAQYLEEARAMGDVLIVAMNSDASVRRLKGPKRPVIGQQDRALMLAALESVDYVVIFEEDTPYEVINILEPDLLVKGGDWTPDQIVGADIVLARGGEVKSLPFRPGLSTSSIIERIRESM